MIVYTAMIPPPMKLREDAVMLSHAVEHCGLDGDAVIEWADKQVAEMYDPPRWLKDLAAHPTTHATAHLHTLRENATDDLLSTERRLITVIDAHNAGVLNFHDVCEAMYYIWQRAIDYELQDFPDAFKDALILWDREERHKSVPPTLDAEIEKLFHDYRYDRRNIESYYTNNSN